MVLANQQRGAVHRTEFAELVGEFGLGPGADGLVSHTLRRPYLYYKQEDVGGYVGYDHMHGAEDMAHIVGKL